MHVNSENWRRPSTLPNDCLWCCLLIGGMEEQHDPRFFISTVQQRAIAADVAATEPQLVCPGLYLSSRDAVLHKKPKLLELGITHILMCCDRAPDDPRTFSYKVVPCNNESRDAGDQHAHHLHDEEGECCGAEEGSCKDLHLLKWIDAVE
jgi:hypothetical protein